MNGLSGITGYRSFYQAHYPKDTEEVPEQEENKCKESAEICSDQAEEKNIWETGQSTLSQPHNSADAEPYANDQNFATPSVLNSEDGTLNLTHAMSKMKVAGPITIEDLIDKICKLDSVFEQKRDLSDFNTASFKKDSDNQIAPINYLSVIIASNIGAVMHLLPIGN